MTGHNIPIKNIGLGISTASLDLNGCHIHILMTRINGAWHVRATMDDKSVDFSQQGNRYAAAEEAIDRLISLEC